MITEIITIDVRPGAEQDFEAAIVKAKPLLLNAKGNLGFDLQRSIEKPQRFRVFVRWTTLESHTIDFARSPDFEALVALITPFATAQPEMEHTEIVLAWAIE